MITYPPRLARDVAHAVVTACESGSRFVWLSERIRELLGPDAQRALADTRRHLVRPTRIDARDVEAGLWQVRVDELLSHRPELHQPLHRLVAGAGGRFARQSPYWPAN